MQNARLKISLFSFVTTSGKPERNALWRQEDMKKSMRKRRDGRLSGLLTRVETSVLGGFQLKCFLQRHSSSNLKF